MTSYLNSDFIDDIYYLLVMLNKQSPYVKRDDSITYEITIKSIHRKKHRNIKNEYGSYPLCKEFLIQQHLRILKRLLDLFDCFDNCRGRAVKFYR